MNSKNILQKTIVDLIDKINTVSFNDSIGQSEKYARLQSLTKELILAKQNNNELKNDPAEEVMSVHVPVPNGLGDYLADKTVLITGGNGTVGRKLVEILLKFSLKKIVLIDKNTNEINYNNNDYITFSNINIANYTGLEMLFEKHKPDIVFHLAAERLPGKVEKNIKQTIESNLIGTKNIAELSGRYNVEKFVLASSGKCRNFFDERLYTMTKKLDELLVCLLDRKYQTNYLITRFHHIMENTYTKQLFGKQIEAGCPVTLHVHSEELRQTYNADIAASLTLNSLTYSLNNKSSKSVFCAAGQAYYFSVLDIALYMIIQSKKDIPIMFIRKNIEDGYLNELKGMENQELPDYIAHAFNTLETGSIDNSCKYLTRAQHLDFDTDFVDKELSLIFNNLNSISESEVKPFLHFHLFAIMRHIMTMANKALVLKCFSWSMQGIDDVYVFQQNQAAIKLLVEAIGTYTDLPRETFDDLRICAAMKLKIRQNDIVNMTKTGCPKMLILGASGFLGFNIFTAAKKCRIEKYITGTYNTRMIENGEFFSLQNGTSDNYLKLRNLLEIRKPDIIINCLGLSKPRDCGARKQSAYYINTDFVKLLLNVVEDISLPCKIIHISTEQTANSSGKYEKLPENFITQPPDKKFVYAYTKWAAEEAIEINDKKGIATIVRLPLMIGRSPYSNTFDYELITGLTSKKTMTLYHDEKRRFANAEEIAYCLLQIAVKLYNNINMSRYINLPGPESIDRNKLLAQIKQVYQLDDDKCIQKISAKDVPGRVIEFMVDANNMDNLDIDTSITTIESLSLMYVADKKHGSVSRILGLIYNCNNPSVTLLEDGEIKYLVEEERFIREKHANRKFPINAINYCLGGENLKILDIDTIAIAWDTNKYHGYIDSFDKELIQKYSPSAYAINWLSNDKERFNKKNLEKQLFLHFPELAAEKSSSKICYVSHHLAHAASAYYLSGFNDACVITADGHGEEDAIHIWKADNGNIADVCKWDIPQSLGWFYTKFTTWFGFDAHDGEGKLMGLAAYGKEDEEINKKLDKVCSITGDARIFEMNPSFFFDKPDDKGYTNEWINMFGQPLAKGGKYTDEQLNLAYGVQKRLEDIMVAVMQKAVKETKSKKVCAAGGVFMNCKLNGILAKLVGYENYYVQPLAGDNGCSLGAALYTYNQNADIVRNKRLSSLYHGTEFTNDEIEETLRKCDVKYRKSTNVTMEAARMLSDSKVIGWFQGKMEAGARALGNRSILGNPMNKDMRNIVNNKVKFRESWRPFCPSILRECVTDYCDIDIDMPFMIVAVEAKENCVLDIPSVVHVDKTMRIQTVTQNDNAKYYRLISDFRFITGCAAVLNTSLNLSGEPVANTPLDAVNCLTQSGMDAIVIGDFVVEKP